MEKMGRSPPAPPPRSGHGSDCRRPGVGRYGVIDDGAGAGADSSLACRNQPEEAKDCAVGAPSAVLRLGDAALMAEALDGLGCSAPTLDRCRAYLERGPEYADTAEPGHFHRAVADPRDGDVGTGFRSRGGGAPPGIRIAGFVRVGRPHRMYGLIGHPRSWPNHLDVTRRIQRRTHGFNEMVLLSFVHTGSPIHLQMRWNRV